MRSRMPVREAQAGAGDMGRNQPTQASRRTGDQAMNALVERLRDNTKFETWETLTALLADAAEEIERLQEKIAALELQAAAMQAHINALTGELILSRAALETKHDQP